MGALKTKHKLAINAKNLHRLCPIVINKQQRGKGEESERGAESDPDTSLHTACSL